MSASMEKQPPHHVRGEICATRKKYREGRRDTAVKVFTINQESKYLLVQGIPAVGACQEMIKLFALYGAVEEYRIIDDYPSADQYTDVCWIKFQKIQAARVAKRKMDDYSFFGGVLHVCYAPEYETVVETREKLLDRRKGVAARIRKLKEEEAQSTETNSDSATISDKHDELSQLSIMPPKETPPEPSASANAVGESVSYNTNATCQSFLPGNQQRVNGSGDQWSSSRNDPSLQSQGYPLHQQDSRNHFQQNYSNSCNTVNPFANPYAFPLHQNLQRQYQYDHARVPSAHSTLPVGFNPYPESSSLHDNYHNRLVERTDIKSTEKTEEDKTQSTGTVKTNERVVNGIIVRDFEKKPSQVPKFVPRQTVSKRRNVNMDIESASVVKKIRKSNEKQKAADSENSTDEKSKSVVKRDKLDEELRRNAFVLGPVAGPSDPDGKKKKSEEDASIEKSRSEIRERLKKFSTIAIPRQLLTKKTQKNVKKSSKRSTNSSVT